MIRLTVVELMDHQQEGRREKGLFLDWRESVWKGN